MQYFLKTVSLLFLFGFSTASPAWAGGSDGAGGDSILPDSGTAWFLGTKPVRYCVVVDPTFGVSKEQVNFAIRQSIATWKKYISSRLNYPGNLIKYAVDFSSHVNCTENDSDLVFYFGTSSQEIEKIKTKYHQPSAFAHRISYDEKTGWGRGFVWVASPLSMENNKFPNWHAPYLLSGIILHELGHVFGCDHVDGTIMTKFIAKLLSEAEQFPKKAFDLMTKIDHTQSLFPYFNDLISGRFGQRNKPDANSALFERLTGRKVMGNILRTELISFTGYRSLLITDRAGTSTIQISVPLNEDYENGSNFFHYGDTEIFKAYLKTEKMTVIESRKTYGSTSLALVKGYDGKEYPALEVVNADQYSADNGSRLIRIMIEGKSFALFSENRGSSERSDSIKKLGKH